MIDADDATTTTVVTRRSAMQSSVPGITAEAATEIEVPVFLGYGEVDVSTDPHAEPAFFSRSPDITLYLLAGSGHCHNMAATRRVLWERLLDWCDAVATPVLG